jgi:hypothetical protein
MRIFLMILAAALGCAALGSGLGWLIGTISPEFIAMVVEPYPVAEPPELGTVLGLLSGLLLGAGVMAFALLVEAFRLWVASRGKTSEQVVPNQTPHQRGNSEDRPSNYRIRQA